KSPVGKSVLEYLLSFSRCDKGLTSLWKMIFHTLSSELSLPNSLISLSISSESPHAPGRLSGSASQHRSASFLYSSGAESGIDGCSPPIISHTKSLSNCLSLKGDSPVALKYIMIPNEYTSDFFVNLQVWKTSGAINGKTPRMVEFDSREFTDRESPRSHMNGSMKRVSSCK